MSENLLQISVPAMRVIGVQSKGIMEVNIEISRYRSYLIMSVVSNGELHRLLQVQVFKSLCRILQMHKDSMLNCNVTLFSVQISCCRECFSHR